MTIQLLREVPGTIGGAPSTFYLVHDDACPERKAVIHLDSQKAVGNEASKVEVHLKGQKS